MGEGRIMLTFPLKKQWYEKIKSGEKTIEYREVKPYWTKRLNSCFIIPAASQLLEGIRKELTFDYVFPYRLRLGYTKEYLSVRIIKIEIVDGKDTDLHIDKPVYAIHLAEVKE
jgi:hypothetical protein